MAKKYKFEKNEENYDSQLTIKRYLGLALVIILLLIILFGISNLEYFIKRNKDVLDSKKDIHIEASDYSNIIERNGLYSDGFTLVSEKGSIIEDGLKSAKIKHFLVSSLSHIKSVDDNLILDSSILKNSEDLNIIQNFIDEKKTIVFLNMPELKYIEDYKLNEILGISSIKKETNQNKLNIVPGFMLGGFHELDIDYISSNIKLLSTTKVYAFGEDNLPIIWRNIYKGSQIYVVNGPFMETQASYGILSAILSEIYEDYIYPIVNTRLMTYEGFPYISYENKEKLEELYNRDAMNFQHDILLPDILGINKRRQFVPNGYLSIGFEDKLKNNINEYNLQQINGFKTQIYKVGGEIGIKYSEEVEFQGNIYKDIFGQENIKSVLVNEKIKDIEKLKERLPAIQSVLGPPQGGYNFGYLDENIIYIPITIDGINTTGEERLEFISGLTSFGAIVHNLSLKDIVLFKGNKENWTETTKRYVRFIDDYRNSFKTLKNRNIKEASNAVKIFRKNSPSINSTINKIEIRLDSWHGETFYILRTDKEIINIKNGKFEKIEEDIYLITARNKEVDIEMRLPKNINASR